MKNLKLLIRLMGVFTLTTIATTSITACGSQEKGKDKKSEETKVFKNDYDKTECIAFWNEFLTEDNSPIGGYFFIWNDKELKLNASILVFENNIQAVKKIDKLMKIASNKRPDVTNYQDGSLSKINFTYTKTLEIKWNDPQFKIAGGDQPFVTNSFVVDNFVEIN